jgi:hypothetical protein
MQASFRSWPKIAVCGMLASVCYRENTSTVIGVYDYGEVSIALLPRRLKVPHQG